MVDLSTLSTVAIIDSHTAGEPTRCVLSGAPNLGSASMASRLEILRCQYDGLRRAILAEPRGSEILVGALLLPPCSPDAATGVIYFNNTGYLGMCGHGSIGVLATLAHMGKIQPGRHKIETPVGTVEATLHDQHRVSIHNLPAYRFKADVALDVPDYGCIHGDIAWGGNWFFLVHPSENLPLDRLTAAHAPTLLACSRAIREALDRAEIRAAGGAEIDHIELFGPAGEPANHCRNFVLCPGMEYDRSPCGTGTSAKLACLAADGQLAPGQLWRQEGILGSVFEGCYEPCSDPAFPPGAIYPTITGKAWITATANLLFDPTDPLREGVPA